MNRMYDGDRVGTYTLSSQRYNNSTARMSGAALKETFKGGFNLCII